VVECCNDGDITATWPSQPTGGNLLIAITAHRDDAAQATISDSGWTKIVEEYFQTSGSNRRGLAVFYKIAEPNESMDVTSSWVGSTTSNTLMIREFASSEGGFVFDATASNNSGTAEVSSLSTGTTSVSALDNTFVISALGQRGDPGAASWTNGLSNNLYESGYSMTVQSAWSQDSAAGTKESTASWSSTEHTSAAIAVFGLIESPVSDRSALRVERASQSLSSMFDVRFSGNTLFTVNENGRVGIGTTSPQEKLDVVGNIRADNITASDTLAALHGNISGNLTAGGNATVDGTLRANGDFIYKWSDESNGGVSFSNPSNNGEINVYNTSGSLRSRISTHNSSFVNTEFGIGTTNPNDKYMLDVSGSANISGDARITDRLILGNSDVDSNMLYDGTIGQTKLSVNYDAGRFTFASSTNTTYNIGDTGPSGGEIFFIDYHNEHSFDYLEAAPDGWDGSVDPSMQWGCRGQSVSGVFGSSVGDGAQNTQLIVDFHDDTSNFSGEDYYTYTGSYSDIGCADSNNGEVAAKYVDELVYNGFSDWFLPSEDELDLFYKNIAEGGSGYESYYWTSTQTSSWDAMFQAFSNGRKDSTNKWDSNAIRPVRAFTDGGSTSSTSMLGIGTIAPAYALDVVTADAIAARFSGRVIGSDAVNNDEFITLGQANTNYQSAGDYFLQGGNAYGELATLGTTDDQDLRFMTNNSERIRVTNAGAISLQGTTTVQTTSEDAFRVLDASSTERFA
ncbi:MAG: hypothetical protein LC687_02035, partial [Actinobacteria bacterium]|nr:hypothetical protein [Actinomycetota bacterium]